jgi:hypothetical protein
MDGSRLCFDISEKPGWQKAQAGIFLDVDAAISAYDNGQFCYDCYGEEGRRSFWGEACISKIYVERRWQEIFDVCDYVEDRGGSSQNVIVARKRACSSEAGARQPT